MPTKKATVKTKPVKWVNKKWFAGKVQNRWNHASTEDKVLTILGVLLLIRGLYTLRQFIRWIVLILIGILLINKYFIHRK
jgi:hypothetical protein